MNRRMNRPATAGTAPTGRALICASVLFSSCCYAAPGEEIERALEREERLRSAGVVQFTFDKDFKVRGWRVLPNVYFGQAKIANEWGIGFLIEQDGYAYGINNERLSFVMRF